MQQEDGALVQWLKLPAWKVGDRGIESHSDLQISKKQNVSSPLRRFPWPSLGTQRWPETPFISFFHPAKIVGKNTLNIRSFAETFLFCAHVWLLFLESRVVR